MVASYYCYELQYCIVVGYSSSGCYYIMWIQKSIISLKAGLCALIKIICFLKMSYFSTKFWHFFQNEHILLILRNICPDFEEKKNFDKMCNYIWTYNYFALFMKMTNFVSLNLFCPLVSFTTRYCAVIFLYFMKHCTFKLSIQF